MSTIGKRIKARREQLDMSQEELALKLGYKSRSSINKIELDERDLPQSLIKKTADALGVTPAYIMGWEEEQKKPLTEDEELEALLEEARERSDLRMLFKLAQGATPDDVRQAIKIIKALREEA